MKVQKVKWIGLLLAVFLMMVACIGTSTTTYIEETESVEIDDIEEPELAESENQPLAEKRVSSLSPVMTPDGDLVGESNLEREIDKILLNFEACCVVPGNAYTAWWVIGDVTKPMSAVETLLATGFVAEVEQVNLALELKAGSGGIDNPRDGVRVAVLDHGLANGDPLQLSTPGGGCTSMPCPVALETSHPAP